jgi:hypothetical protein
MTRRVFRREHLAQALTYFLSSVPQAEPQTEGFSTGLLPAPQAVPQAAGFSAGLSPASQADPVPFCQSECVNAIIVASSVFQDFILSPLL